MYFEVKVRSQKGRTFFSHGSLIVLSYAHLRNYPRSRSLAQGPHRPTLSRRTIQNRRRQRRLVGHVVWCCENGRSSRRMVDTLVFCVLRSPIATWPLPLSYRDNLAGIVKELISLSHVPGLDLGGVYAPARAVLATLWPCAGKRVGMDSLMECLAAVFGVFRALERECETNCI
ncbi:hypothetical protein BKA82DRAFT_2627342 [Pisolithus tinctorius]|nr:hypothetical protein BKA82DRAFT_2627342 [Pisolithus tinctorius]